ncbi:MAG: N-acetyltransferase [Patescibacteria group bacterium]|jgi:GNAT superfamily N-acetyltransferase|nr:N-acetyltransferase [Patescibacteria group bacterium]
MPRVAGMTASGTTTSDELQIRKMGLRDVRSLRRLFDRSVDDSFTYFPVEYRAKLRRQHSIARLVKAYVSPKAHFMLLTREGTDIGYCLLRFQQDRAYIFWMYVDPKFRGIRAGEQLLQSSIEVAAQHNLVALQLVTHDKEEFYAKYGFVPLRHVSGLVGGIDMVIMEYSI